ncbi:MAG: hypothetical protein JSU63_02605 [Phycisphaerales bacterium]|nr:MAG: hypothetical protein JSU63_02605 [Phycisphaerales bacterium]
MLGARTRPTYRGMTLLEVVLSMGLLVLLTSMTYWFYSSVLGTRTATTEEAQKLRLLRVTINRISREINQASVLTADNRVGLRGEPERLWLSTLRVPSRDLTTSRLYRDEVPSGEYDIVKTEYKIARHPEILHDDGYEIPLGLARVEILIPRPDSAETGEAFEDEERIVGESEEADAIAEALLEEALLGAEEGSAEPTVAEEIQWEELYAPEIRYLRLCYFDGNKWWDDWDIQGENPLPQLVMVTLGFEGHAPFGEEFGRGINEEFCECLNNDPVDCEPLAPDQFSSVVRVAQADPLFRSRISREAQDFMEKLQGETEEE